MTRPDVIVVGLGPAGAALASGLAREGLGVHLMDGGAPQSALEGYSEKTRALLYAAHLPRTADSLIGPVPRQGNWGDRDVAGMEWLSDRRRVHGCLRQDVIAAGVQVTAMRWSAAHTRDALKRGAKMVVDATGRHGPAQSGPRLLAIAASTPSVSGIPGTRVGTWSAGWYWIADDGNRTQLQMIGRPRAGRPENWLRMLCDEQPALSDLASNLSTRLTARAAHARLAQLDDPLTRVGDAALSIDPLSGHGVYEAIQSANLHLTAIRTVMAGGDISVVREYVQARRQEIWARTLQVATGFYREPPIETSFWRTCAATYQAVLESLPRHHALDTRIERKAVLDDGYIRERPVIVTPDLPRGAWRVAGIPVVELVDFLRTDPLGASRVDEASRHFNTPKEAVLTAMSWLKSIDLTAVSA